MAFDAQAPAAFGPHQEFLASGRLDNLSSVHASLVALINSAGSELIEMIIACDHEELGSESRSGASGPLLADVITRISNSLGATSRPAASRRWPRRSSCPRMPDTPSTRTIRAATIRSTSRCSTPVRC